MDADHAGAMTLWMISANFCSYNSAANELKRGNLNDPRYALFFLPCLTCETWFFCLYREVHFLFAALLVCCEKGMIAVFVLGIGCCVQRALLFGVANLRLARKAIAALCLELGVACGVHCCLRLREKQLRSSCLSMLHFTFACIAVHLRSS